MKLKAKVSLLAGAIALAGVVYVPTAAAEVHHLVPPITVQVGQSVSSGAFTNDYKFDVSERASGVGTGNSSTSTLNLNTTIIGTSGVTLSSISFWDGANKIASVNASATGSGSSTFPGGYTLAGTAYGAVLSYLPFQVGHTYTFEISGTNLNTSGGAYAGSLTLNPAPVPEPEEWAMMLVGAGLVSYQVRRKQKGLSQSTLA